MNCIFKMAIKDLRILSRDRMGAFFIVGFPILMGVFFGLIMGGGASDSGSAKMKIVVVDQDNSEMSKKFIDALSANESLAIESIDPTQVDAQLDSTDVASDQRIHQRNEMIGELARLSVQKGSRVGMIVVPSGFGENAGMFWGEPTTLQVGMDPSRAAESGMVHGFIMEAIGGLIGERMANPLQMKSSIAKSRNDIMDSSAGDPVSRQLMLGFLGTVDTMLESMDQIQNAPDDSDQIENQGNFEFANIESIDVARVYDPKSQAGQLKKLRSSWDMSFPQAMMWGVLGCVAGFSISIAREKTNGTILRLQVAPISRFQILAGKALACFLTSAGVITMLVVLGVIMGMKPASYPLLVLAAFSVSFCFVGIMMTLSVLGKTEQSVAGIGWAINMVMAMLGGAMIPVMFMKDWMQQMSVLSPIRWGILAIEGAVWREFSLAEMALPCLVLIGIGCTGLAIGTLVLSRPTS